MREKVPSNIPIIMYSTTRNEEKIKKAYDLGANLFITKPDNTTSLSNALQWVVQEEESRFSHTSYKKKNFHLQF